MKNSNPPRLAYWLLEDTWCRPTWEKKALSCPLIFCFFQSFVFKKMKNVDASEILILIYITLEIIGKKNKHIDKQPLAEVQRKKNDRHMGLMLFFYKHFLRTELKSLKISISILFIWYVPIYVRAKSTLEKVFISVLELKEERRNYWITVDAHEFFKFLRMKML